MRLQFSGALAIEPYYYYSHLIFKRLVGLIGRRYTTLFTIMARWRIYIIACYAAEHRRFREKRKN